jgi:hypothetical protein
VFAVIDTASKTGTEHDATAVTFFARTLAGGRFPLLVLDWDIAQIEGAFLETWLPSVFDRLEELARLCGARHGSLGALIEDKNSGTILAASPPPGYACPGYRLQADRRWKRRASHQRVRLRFPGGSKIH